MKFNSALIIALATSLATASEQPRLNKRVRTGATFYSMTGPSRGTSFGLGPSVYPGETFGLNLGPKTGMGPGAAQTLAASEPAATTAAPAPTETTVDPVATSETPCTDCDAPATTPAPVEPTESQGEGDEDTTTTSTITDTDTKTVPASESPVPTSESEETSAAATTALAPETTDAPAPETTAGGISNNTLSAAPAPIGNNTLSATNKAPAPTDSDAGNVVMITSTAHATGHSMVTVTDCGSSSVCDKTVAPVEATSPSQVNGGTYNGVAGGVVAALVAAMVI